MNEYIIPCLILGFEIGFLVGEFYIIYIENKRIDNIKEREK